MTANSIAITSYTRARRIKRRFDAVLTIEDPNFKQGLRFHKRPHPDHLVLELEDLDTPEDNVALPHMEHVVSALQFGREHTEGRLLIHCRAGIARSTALALGIISDRLGAGYEKEAVQQLLKIRPQAIPNLIILDLADEYLGRDGHLRQAWLDIENSNSEYAIHRLDKRNIWVRQPHLFSKPFNSVCYSVSRYSPDSLVRKRGVDFTSTEPVPSMSV